MAKKEAVDALADEFLSAAEKKLGHLRRPTIRVSETTTQALKRALQREGSLVYSTEAFVRLLGLSKSYGSAEKVHLLISSLNRRWAKEGIHLGQRGMGKYVTVTLVGR